MHHNLCVQLRVLLSLYAQCSGLNYSAGKGSPKAGFASNSGTIWELGTAYDDDPLSAY